MRQAETSPTGNTTTWTCDESANMLTETDPLGHVTTWTYDGYGNELSQSETCTTDAGVVTMTTVNEYDIRHRLVRSIDPLGHETLTEYNSRVNKESRIIDKNGAETLFEYDNNGNQAAIHYADGTSQLTTYDGEGNRTSTTDRVGKTTCINILPFTIVC